MPLISLIVPKPLAGRGSDAGCCSCLCLAHHTPPGYLLLYLKTPSLHSHFSYRSFHSDSLYLRLDLHIMVKIGVSYGLVT